MADESPSPSAAGEGRPAAPPEPLPVRLRRMIGGAAEARPPATLGSALAGVAALIGAFAVATLGGEVLENDNSRVLAALITAVYGAGGAVLLVRGDGPQRSAGAVAAAASVFLTLGFLILGEGQFDEGDTTVVLALSTIIWAVLYFVGPSRGYGVMLGAALGGVWLSIVVQLGLEDILALTTLPLAGFGGFVPAPDNSDIIIVTLLFGGGYLALGHLLDREELHGIATGFMGAGLVVTAIGITIATAGQDDWVVAILFVSTGAYVAYFGALAGRRFTTWAGTITLLTGFIVLATTVVSDEGDVAESIVILALMVAIALISPIISDALGEESPLGRRAPRGAPPPPDQPTVDPDDAGNGDSGGGGGGGGRDAGGEGRKRPLRAG